jgi:predicted GH43/DUF377 family glycosyl hydrolase
MRRGWGLAGICILAGAFAGCGGYGDFTLPPLHGGNPGMTFALEQHPGPVLRRDNERDVLNPSVARASSGLVNFYSAFDGAVWRTAVADSADGLVWRKGAALLAPDPRTWESGYIAANGSVLFHQGQYWYWYQAGVRDRPRIGLLRVEGDPRSGGSVRKEPAPVLDYGPYMSWDEQAVADPYVIRIEPYFYMYYLGQDRARRQRLGLARSTDGIHWQKYQTNPILELGGPGGFDENGLGEPAVWQSHGYYWMLYTGRDVSENRRLGLARSTDAVRWEKLPAVFSGSEAWNAKVLCDPTVEVSGGAIVVWFGGGDVASPDENLNGQIGMGVLRPVSAKEPR